MNYEAIGESFQQTHGALSHFSFYDFRPTFDGYLVNLAIEIGRSANREATLANAWHQFREMLTWTLQNKDRFGSGDKVQIVVAWTETVRKTCRQILKGGIAVASLSRVPPSLTFAELHKMGGFGAELPGWDKGVFK